MLASFFQYLIKPYFFIKSKFQKPQEVFQSKKKDFIESTVLDEPTGFGYKNMWLAVRCNKKEFLANDLQLKILGKANWENGFEHAYEYYDRKVFITPEINGWTLVCGWGLHDLLNITNTSINSLLLNHISLKYREAQYFITERVSDSHLWCKFINGELVRYYSSMDGEITSTGEKTELEKNLFDPNLKEFQTDFNDDDLSVIYVNEDLVMDIAKSWSIDPSNLQDYSNIKQEFGLVCEVIF